MGPYHVFKKEKEEYYKEECKRKLMASEEYESLSEKMQIQYLKENEPRTLIDVFSSATVEGFVATRKEYGIANFGGVLVVISEFSDYILNATPAKEDFLSLIKEVYEEGSNYAKVIKGERRAESVVGVPNSILFQSTPTGLLEKPGSEKMIKFLDKGIGRRALLCFPEIEPKQIQKRTLAEAKEYFKKMEEEGKEMQNIISRSTYMNPAKNIFEFTEEADENHLNYIYNMQQIGYEGQNESLVADMKSRPRKIQKLSGIIAMIEHPNDNRICIEDVTEARKIVEHYGQYLDKFIDKLFEDSVVKLFNFLKAHEGTTLRLMDIRKQRFVGANTFARWIEEITPEVQSYAFMHGYELEITELGSIGKGYSLKEIKIGEEYFLGSIT
jgi:hypothetical protein